MLPFQLFLSVLAVPVVTAALTAVGRFISPTRRMSTQIMGDLSIYKDLPEGNVKDAFGDQIKKRTLDLMDYRSRPRIPAWGWVVILTVPLLLMAGGLAWVLIRLTEAGRADFIPVLLAAVAGLIGVSFTFAISMNAGRLKERRRIWEQAVGAVQEQMRQRSERLHKGQDL